MSSGRITSPGRASSELGNSVASSMNAGQKAVALDQDQGELFSSATLRAAAIVRCAGSDRGRANGSSATLAAAPRAALLSGPQLGPADDLFDSSSSVADLRRRFRRFRIRVFHVRVPGPDPRDIAPNSPAAGLRLARNRNAPTVEVLRIGNGQRNGARGHG